nr:synaptonemal complex protein 2-like [Columba livia]
MTARAEDYLESLLTDAFKGKGFQKISELLQEREIQPPQKYSESLFSHLDKALRKELDKNEFQNVSLLLKCIQLYFKSDLQEGTSLFVEQGLVEKMISWFERARTFVTVIDPENNKSLMSLLEDFFDSALVICKCSNEGKKELVNLFLPELGNLVTEAGICCALRQEVALSEALCRLMTKKWRDDLVHHWFEDNYLAEAFKEIKDREFETVKKPSDEKLEDFWIDFNMGSQSVTFYVDSNEINVSEEESIRAGKQANQDEAVIPESTDPQRVKDPSNSGNTEALSDKAFQQSQQLTGTVAALQQKQIKRFIVAAEGEAVVSLPPSAKKSKTPSPRTKAKPSTSQTDYLDFKRTAPQHCIPLMCRLVPSEKPLEEQPMEESMPKKGATRVTRKRTRSLAKQKTEGRKGIYDFENSDSASHEKVAEAKAKILGQKASSQKQRNYETRNRNEESSKLERRQLRHVEAFLLMRALLSRPRREGEMRMEDAASPMLAKVLPMSSASSGSDDQMKKRASRQKAQEEEMPGKKSTSSSKGDDLPTVNLDDETPSEIEGSPLLLDVPDEDSSSDVEATQKFLDAFGKWSREEESSKRKDSGQEMDDSVDNASFSKMLNEDFTDSGMVAAFENFIGQLKKSLWCDGVWVKLTSSLAG